MPSFATLVEEILVLAKRLDETLDENDIPYPSFDDDTLKSLPKYAQKTRKELLDASHNLRQLVRGAKQSGFDIALGWTQQVILRIIWRYKLASAIPIDGSANYKEISVASGLDVLVVARTIRSAMTLNIFDESEPGRIRHTAISKLLATNEGFQNIIGVLLDDIGPASIKLMEAWEMFGDVAEEPCQSAFSLSNGGRSIFKVLAEEPDRAFRFDSAMKYCVEDRECNSFDIVGAFDWPKIDQPGSRLVDVGGGYGQNCQVLAQHTEHLAFTVQDLPHVVEQGLERLLSQFHERIAFEARSFLEPRGEEHPADVYLFSRCLHNWSDYHCAKIFRYLVPVLRQRSTILIWDSVLSDRPTKNLSERYNFQQDFIMATLSNGKDRSAEEFRQVLELSDERYKIETIVKPSGSKLSMIEISWAA